MVARDILTNLAAGLCVPLGGDYQPLTPEQIDVLVGRLPTSWAIEDKQLQRIYCCQDYSQAAALTQQIAMMAESVNHHPQLVLEWCRVTVRINTHVVDGLALGDFVFAAKTELLSKNFRLISNSGMANVSD